MEPIDNQVTITRVPDKKKEPKNPKPKFEIIKKPVVMSFN